MFYIHLMVIILGFILAPAAAHALTEEEIYKIASPAVYPIFGANQEKDIPQSIGNAVAVSKTVLATNCQVALSKKYIWIKSANKNESGKIIYKDTKQDLCLIEIPSHTLQFIKLNQSAETGIGEEVFVIGTSENLNKSLSKGTLFDKLKYDENDFIIQTDALIPTGTSGSGLFDSNGRLIGITTNHTVKANISTAIPSEWIVKVMPKEPEPIPTVNTVNGQINNALVALGIFGKDKVGLYRHNDRCYIYINGYNENNELTSSALWSPAQADKLIIFQNTNSANISFDILDNQVIKKRDNNDLKIINSYLILDGDTYDLLGNTAYPFMVATLDEDPVSLLIGSDQFAVKLKDADNTAHDPQITFKLLGLNEAMTAYNNVCKAKPTQPQPSEKPTPEKPMNLNLTPLERPKNAQQITP